MPLQYFSTPFELLNDRDPKEKPVQIHALSTSDGQRVYVAYSASALDGSGKLAVFVTAFNASGERAFAPIGVSVGDANETDTAIAVRGSTLLVAWSASTDQARVRWRTLSTDGQTLGAVHNGPELRFFGTPLADSQLNPWATATPTGFALGGAWGVPGFARFQAAMAPLNPDGSIAGNVRLLGYNASQSQDGVRLSTQGSNVLATWLSAADDERATLMYNTLLPNAEALADAGSPADGATSDGGVPLLAPSSARAVGTAQANDSNGHYVIYNDTSDVAHLRAWGATTDLATWNDFGSLLSVASPGAEGGVALGITGSTNEGGGLHARRFDATGKTLAEETLPTEGAGVSSLGSYDVKLVHVSGNQYFVAYQEPTADKGWVAKGTFLRFP